MKATEIYGFERGVIAPGEEWRGSIMVRTVDVINGNLWRVFPAINVDRCEDIPCDYPGAMGVPITFMDKFNSGQFEILGISNHDTLINGRQPYRRIFVRNLRPELPEEIDLTEWMRRAGCPIALKWIGSEDNLPPEATPALRREAAKPPTRASEPQVSPPVAATRRRRGGSRQRNKEIMNDGQC